MKLESGPAAYDRNYYLAFLVLCVGLCGYFLYDYIVGYVNKNREVARKQLIPLVGADNVPDKFGPAPTKPVFDALAQSQPTDPAAVREALGAPFTVKQTVDGESIEYYVSDYGMATVRSRNGRIQPNALDWRSWGKSKEEIRVQLYCALFALAVGLYVLYRVYKAATLRAAIDDEGMTYGGRRILFDDMARLCDYSRKGWVDLYYRRGSEERKLRIDNQKIRKFDEIIDTLCEIKGFEDPRAAAEEAEAAPEPEDPTKTEDSRDAK
jgi:hypothetical protein